jgi:hypothetical protein
LDFRMLGQKEDCNVQHAGNGHNAVKEKLKEKFKFCLI